MKSDYNWIGKPSYEFMSSGVFIGNKGISFSTVKTPGGKLKSKSWWSR